MYSHRFHRLRGFCFSQLGVLGKLYSESELSPQRLAVVHKAILQCPICEAGQKHIFRSGLTWIFRIVLTGIEVLVRIAYVVYRMSLEEAEVGISQLTD